MLRFLLLTTAMSCISGSAVAADAVPPKEKQPAVQLVSSQLYQYWSPEHIRYYGYEVVPSPDAKGEMTLQTCDHRVFQHLKPADLKEQVSDNCLSVRPGGGVFGWTILSTAPKQNGSFEIRILDAGDKNWVGHTSLADKDQVSNVLHRSASQAVGKENKPTFWAAQPNTVQASFHLN